MLKPLSEKHILEKARNCFYNQRQRCYTKTNPYFNNYGAKGIRVEYDRIAFMDWFLKEFKKFNEEFPSVGRIDHSKNYSFSNIRFESLADNSLERIMRVGTTGPRRAIHIIDAQTKKIIKTVESLVEAGKEAGICHTHISGYCKGKHGTTESGLTFRYVDEIPSDNVKKFEKKSKLKCPIIICDGKTSSPIFIAYNSYEVMMLTGIHKAHINRYCRGELKISKAGYSLKYLDAR